MNSNLQKIQRVVMATAFASGIVAAGVAASAQTTAAPAAASSVNATSVSMSTTGDAKAKRQAELDAQNADARRVAFLHQGTSL